MVQLQANLRQIVSWTHTLIGFLTPSYRYCAENLLGLPLDNVCRTSRFERVLVDNECSNCIFVGTRSNSTTQRVWKGQSFIYWLLWSKKISILFGMAPCQIGDRRPGRELKWQLLQQFWCRYVCVHFVGQWVCIVFSTAYHELTRMLVYLGYLVFGFSLHYFW